MSPPESPTGTRYPHCTRHLERRSSSVLFPFVLLATTVGEEAPTHHPDETGYFRAPTCRWLVYVNNITPLQRCKQSFTAVNGCPGRHLQILIMQCCCHSASRRVRTWFQPDSIRMDAVTLSEVGRFGTPSRDKNAHLRNKCMLRGSREWTMIV